MTGNATDAVTAREHALIAAMLAADVAALDDLIDPRCVFTGPDGTVIDKEADLAGYRAGDLALTGFDLSEHTVHDLGGMVVSTSKASLSGAWRGEPFGGRFAYTRVWTRTDGTWRVICGQGSALPPAA